MGARALSVDNATKRYGISPIFEGLTLEAREGETLVLLGPSGCGKSTLLRVLSGLEPLSSGSLSVPPRGDDGSASVGLVFQDPLLLPWLTVRENVALGLRYRANRSAARKADVQGLLAEFGIEDLADHLPSQLSGGQAQRVSLARTIITGPRVLLMDEPFAALDPRTRGSLQQWLREIRAHHHLTVVMVTHDLDEALALADRVLLFSNRPGRIVGSWDVSPTTLDVSSRATLRAELLDRYETDLGASPLPQRQLATA